MFIYTELHIELMQQILFSLKKEKSVLHNLNVLHGNNNQKLASILNLTSNKTSLEKRLLNNKDCKNKCKSISFVKTNLYWQNKLDCDAISANAV